MAVTHRRLVLDGIRKWRLEEKPLSAPPKGGIIIKTSFAGICHTDVQLSYRLFHPNFVFPRVLGHETDGIIHEISQEAAKAYPKFKLGDRVIVYPAGYCRACAFCKYGGSSCPNVFQNYGKGPVGSQTYGVWKDGGYQNYVIVEDPSLLVKIPEVIPMDQACLIPCSGITAYNACIALQESINRARAVKGKATVALIGCGGLGLWSLKIIKALYTDVTIIAVDINEEKLVDGKAQGADLTYCWPQEGKAEDVAAELVKITGEALDGAIDYTGKQEPILRAFHAMNVYGTLTFVGLTSDILNEIPLVDMICRNVVLRGSMTGSQRQCEELVSLVAQGKIKPPPIEHVTLNDVEKVIDMLYTGEQRGRAVVKFD